MAATDLPTYKVALLAAISPQQTSSGGSQLTTPFVRIATNFGSCLAVMKIGASGQNACAVDFSIEQAKDALGTGVKSILGKSFAWRLPRWGDSTQAEINLLATELDSAGGYGWVRLKMVARGDFALVDACLLGIDPLHPPASDFNIAGSCVVVQF